MPKKLHAKLEKQAEKAGITGERKDAYVYGTMRQIEETKKKKSMLNN